MTCTGSLRVSLDSWSQTSRGVSSQLSSTRPFTSSRDFDGVEKLRALVYEDLDAAVRLGLEMSVEELTQRGVPVHTNTREALRFLTKGE